MRISRPCYWTKRALDDAIGNPLVSIKNGSFYRSQPITQDDKEQKAIFPDLDFTVEARPDARQYWAVVGPSNAGKTTFLEVLQGQHLCFPPRARCYPYLSTETLLEKKPKYSYPARAIQHVSFSTKQKGLAGMGTYLSARYESRREATDFSVLDYLTGNTELNAAPVRGRPLNQALLAQVLKDLRLENLAEMPMSNLSNGQSRRARIAKALMGRPELLLLDEPFMGLDPPTTVQMNPLLRQLAESCEPRLLLSLRTQDPIPDWITHLVYLGEHLRITQQGPKEEVIAAVLEQAAALQNTKAALDKIPHMLPEFGYTITDLGIAHGHRVSRTYSNRLYPASKEKFEKGNLSDPTLKNLGMGQTLAKPKWPYAPKMSNAKERTAKGEPVVEMRGVKVMYGDKTILGGWESQQLMEMVEDTGEIDLRQMEIEGDETKDTSGLWWTVRRGERWLICGPNGSGKTTLLSLLLSDHPQAYSQPVRIFGRSRLPNAGQPGISVFDIQRRIGHSSPEVQAFFPKSLTVRAVLESAYADTPAGRPTMTERDDMRVSACLRWFRGELNADLGMDKILKAEMNRRGKHLSAPYTKLGFTQERYQQAKEQFWYDFEAQKELSVAWADEMKFGELTYSAQRVALFLRAIVAQPDIVVLDEAFGGMDEVVRDKCIMFLEHGEAKSMTPFDPLKGHTVRPSGTGIHKRNTQETLNNLVIPEGLTERQALICVSHVSSEVPVQVEDWMYLPEAGSGEACKVGRVTKALRNNIQLWNTIWGMKRTPTWSSRPGGYGMYYDFQGRKAAFDEQDAELKRQQWGRLLKRELRDDEFASLLMQNRINRASARRGAGRPVGTKDEHKKENSTKPVTAKESRQAPVFLLDYPREEYIAQARAKVQGARRGRRSRRAPEDATAAEAATDGEPSTVTAISTAETSKTEPKDEKVWYDARFTGGQTRRIKKRAPRPRRRAKTAVMAKLATEEHITGKEVVSEDPNPESMENSSLV